MKLFVVHNHFRPGGVRRLVEVAAVYLVRDLRPPVEAIALITGEQPEPNWLVEFVSTLKGVPVSCHVDPTLLYFAEQHQKPGQIVRRLHRFFSTLLGNFGAANSVIWAHNQGLGRNLLLTRELIQVATSTDSRLVLHHHDWWFDNRWQRWSELRRSGFRTLAEVAQSVFPVGANVHAVAVNQADTAILQRHYLRQAAWWPNPVDERPAPPAQKVRAARCWLHATIGQTAPVWLMPCRLVRRKNIAEALLLTRWLRPEGWLLTTGSITSPDEASYARRLQEAALRYGWKLRLGILGGSESSKPSVPQLIAASEAVLLTSLQEGFGFSFIEAAAAGKPLLARSLANMAPDLRKFGFRFPQLYEDILVAPGLFDQAAEHQRQRVLFRQWLEQLPASCRKFVARHPARTATASSQPVPFSRLTLTAQIEVLAWSPAESFARCVPLNPFLQSWRERAASGKLAVSHWPASASRWLSGLAYARRFSKLLDPVTVQKHTAIDPLKIQQDFLRNRLAVDNFYPILWSTQS